MRSEACGIPPCVLSRGGFHLTTKENTARRSAPRGAGYLLRVDRRVAVERELVDRLPIGERGERAAARPPFAAAVRDGARRGPVVRAAVVRRVPVERAAVVRRVPVVRAAVVRRVPVERAAVVRRVPVERAAVVRRVPVERAAVVRRVP